MTARLDAMDEYRPDLRVAVLVDALDGAQFAVGDVALFVRRRELYAVAFTERPVRRSTLISKRGEVPARLLFRSIA